MDSTYNTSQSEGQNSKREIVVKENSECLVSKEMERCKNIIAANNKLLIEGDNSYPKEVYQAVILKATKDLQHLQSLSLQH